MRAGPPHSLSFAQDTGGSSDGASSPGSRPSPSFGLPPPLSPSVSSFDPSTSSPVSCPSFDDDVFFFALSRPSGSPCVRSGTGALQALLQTNEASITPTTA